MKKAPARKPVKDSVAPAGPSSAAAAVCGDDESGQEEGG